MADIRDDDFKHFVCVESGAVRAAVQGGLACLLCVAADTRRRQFLAMYSRFEV
jgi:D-hexose-6-phosphate mutarotase